MSTAIHCVVIFKESYGLVYKLYIPRQTENKGTNVDAAVHGVFYSACQAVIYVLCFRMKNLLDNPTEHEILQSLRISELLSHGLNPLELCLPSFVEEFMKQATAAHLVNERMSMQVNKTMESLTSNTFGCIKQLDMFFPFDPYLLKHSERFIRPNYIFWPMEDSCEEEEEISDVEFEGDENDMEESSDIYFDGAVASSIPTSMDMTCDDNTDSVDESDMKESPNIYSDVAVARSIPTSVDMTCSDTGSVNNDKHMSDFELSLNRMRLDGCLLMEPSIPTHDILQFLKPTGKQPIPLPAKLTPDYLKHYSPWYEI